MMPDSHLSETRQLRSITPSFCLFSLSVFLFSLALLSCALVHPQGNGTEVKETSMEKRTPEPGDLKMVDNVEYIYGKNRRFRSLPGEPEYVWVRKDQYGPRPFDSLKEALSRPPAEWEEIEKLERRISMLEAEIGRLQGTAGTAGVEQEREKRSSDSMPGVRE